MDEIDRKILCELQQNAAIANQELAARVGLSPSPCLRRVRALEATGTIRGIVALVDGKAVGAGFVAYVEVRLEKQSEAFSSRFETAILARPEVLECAFVTGAYDYLLKVARRRSRRVPSLPHRDARPHRRRRQHPHHHPGQADQGDDGAADRRGRRQRGAPTRITDRTRD